MGNETFRTKRPNRTCNKQYKNYQSYKPFLKNDFNSRCGYCNALDKFSTYSCVYQIDHFVPKTKFSDTYKVNDYSNLVYSCPSCNRYKSDKWISDNPNVNILEDKGFVDPCSDMYSGLFERSESGKIIAKNVLGEYIYDELHLYLKRHEIIYKLEKLEKVIDRFGNLHREGKLSESDNKTCLDLLFELVEYSKYLNGKAS